MPAISVLIPYRRSPLILHRFLRRESATLAHCGPVALTPRKGCFRALIARDRTALLPALPRIVGSGVSARPASDRAQADFAFRSVEDRLRNVGPIIDAGTIDARPKFGRAKQRTGWKCHSCSLEPEGIPSPPRIIVIG